jgi:hypothetical protein
MKKVRKPKIYVQSLTESCYAGNEQFWLKM